MFIQTKGKIRDGQLILEQTEPALPRDADVSVFIIFQTPQKSQENDEIRTAMQQSFKEAGIENREQILELIREVKQELIQERQL
jgi:hypothetical protein